MLAPFRHCPRLACILVVLGLVGVPNMLWGQRLRGFVPGPAVPPPLPRPIADPGLMVAPQVTHAYPYLPVVPINPYAQQFQSNFAGGGQPGPVGIPGSVGGYGVGGYRLGGYGFSGYGLGGYGFSGYGPGAYGLGGYGLGGYGLGLGDAGLGGLGLDGFGPGALGGAIGVNGGNGP
jgi:hypothetical protein